MDAPTKTPSKATEPASPGLSPGRIRANQNLIRPQKGQKPPWLQDSKRGPNIKSLESEVRRVLRTRSWSAMEALAKSIVQGAIEREPACLAFLGPRLWPLLEESQSAGKVVFEGIKLEVTEHGAQVTIARKEDVSLLPQEGSSVPTVASESEQPPAA